MRIPKFTFISLLVSLIFVACGPIKKGPEEVAEAFLLHLNTKEYDKAKELCTDNGKKIFEIFESLGDLNSTGEAGRTMIENVRCIIDGDEAVCSFTADGENQEMILLKIDGKWLVDFEIGEEDISAIDEAEADTTVNDSISSDDKE